MLYKIIGADGKEYGPVTTEQLRRWIAEGRANAQTRTLWENGTGWQPLANLPEFATAFFSTPPSGIPPLAAGTARKTNGFAIAGLVCGIISTLCCCAFPLGILGIVFSIVALSQIRRHPELYEGRALAVAGLVLSVVSIFLGMIWLLLSIANNNLQFHSHWNVNRF
jgi:hypothetical protein